MNILLVNPDYPPNAGGGGIAAQNIAENLLREGHDVTIVHGGDSHFSREEDGLKEIQIPTTLLGMENILLELKYSKVPTISGIRKLRDIDYEKFDVVHLFAYPHHPLVDITSILAKNTPKVITIHAITDFTDRSILGAIFKPLNWIYRITLAKKVSDSAKNITTISKSTKKQALDWGVDEEKIRLIGNGVELEKYKPEKKIEKRNYILSIGRIVSHKNFEDLLSAIASLDDENLGLKIVGSIEDEKYKQKLDSLAENLSVSERVQFKGYVSEKKKIELLRKAKIYASTSSSEGFGLTLLEAMASETPVIASKVAGHKDVIEDGKNGILYDPEKLKDLEEEINKLIQDEDCRKNLVREGLKKAENNSWNKISEEYVQVYQDAKN